MNKYMDIANVVLKTQRLILRPWRESDLEDLYEYAKVDGVGQMAGWKPHSNIDVSRAVLSYFIKSKSVFALEHKGKVIGSLGVDEYSEEDHPQLDMLQGREIGYVLSRAYWGQGLMPEAVKEVIRWLFEEEKLDFIVVGHYEKNTQSRRVIEKCGFHYVRTVNIVTDSGAVRNSMQYILYNPNRREEKCLHTKEHRQ